MCVWTKYKLPNEFCELDRRTQWRMWNSISVCRRDVGLAASVTILIFDLMYGIYYVSHDPELDPP